jgi:hypothetical protein
MNELIKELKEEINNIKKIANGRQDVPVEKLNYLLLASLMEEEENVSEKVKPE